MYYHGKATEIERLKMEIVDYVKQKEALNDKIMQNIKRIHELEEKSNIINK